MATLSVRYLETIPGIVSREIRLCELGRLLNDRADLRGRDKSDIDGRVIGKSWGLRSSPLCSFPS